MVTIGQEIDKRTKDAIDTYNIFMNSDDADLRGRAENLSKVDVSMELYVWGKVKENLEAHIKKSKEAKVLPVPRPAFDKCNKNHPLMLVDGKWDCAVCIKEMKDLREKFCEYCGDELSVGVQRFCSNRCQNAYTEKYVRDDDL